MAVTFAPLFNDGTQLIDGVHDYTVQQNNTAQQYLNALGGQWAVTWPDKPPLDITVPGEANGRDLYQVIEDYIAANSAGWNAQTAAIWDRIRISVASGARIESGLIAWR